MLVDLILDLEAAMMIDYDHDVRYDDDNYDGDGIDDDSDDGIDDDGNNHEGFRPVWEYLSHTPQYSL